MRFLRCLSVALVLAAMSWALAGDAADERAKVADFIARLKSPDENVRTQAADEIVAGWGTHVEGVVRGGVDLDEAAWTAFAEACVKRPGISAVKLVAAARAAPQAHRVRLLALARRIDPEAGVERTPAEIEKRVRKIFERSRTDRCLTGYDTMLARLGHDAVPAIVAQVRERGAKSTMSRIASSALAWIAEKEDAPVLRELLLGGITYMSHPLGRLARRDVPEAADALLEAVAADQFGEELAEALECVPDTSRTVKTVREWMEQRAVSSGTSEEQRIAAAKLYAAVDAREMAPSLEEWLATAEKPWEFVALGTSLTHLGSRKGLETLIRIVDEKGLRRCCVGPSAGDLAAADAPNRLCREGFATWDRWHAAERLDAVAGRVVFPRKEKPTTPPSDARRAESDEERLVRAAAAYREWWDASKDQIAFDTATGKWTVGK